MLFMQQKTSVGDILRRHGRYGLFCGVRIKALEAQMCRRGQRKISCYKTKIMYPGRVDAAPLFVLK